MTVLYDDPAEFAEDQLDGFVDVFSDRLQKVVGGVVAHTPASPQVAVVVGGGSGHYPAFSGLVGPGLASAAVVGNIFTSPSAAWAYSVGKAADQGRGVVFSFGNYAGDVMNFGIAAERLRKEGIDTRIQLVTDDIASSELEGSRRGIAGDFVVFKILGAAAARGWNLEDVVRAGAKANAATRTLGIAFSGCTMPGSQEPLFVVPEGKMSVGLGIHGEPGIHDVPLAGAADIAHLLVDKLLADSPENGSRKVAAILNGLGTTKYEELFLLWKHVSSLLVAAGLEIIDPEVGELVTSLDMGGCSLTLAWLDEELESLWRAPAYAPAYRKDNTHIEELVPAVAGTTQDRRDVVSPPSVANKLAARVIRMGLERALSVIEDSESYLGAIDAVAGDGDHGRGMVKGVNAAFEAVRDTDGAAGWTLAEAGRAWAAQAGGTSGVLWGAALEAAGRSIDDGAEAYSATTVSEAVKAFVAAITDLGGAHLGDKTIVDALVPFSSTLSREVSDGKPLQRAWATASEEAGRATEATAELVARKGRARPLGAKGVGTPDPGAVSFSLIVKALGQMKDD